jgi:hypothetical protein
MRREIQNRLIFQPNPESFCRAIIFSSEPGDPGCEYRGRVLQRELGIIGSYTYTVYTYTYTVIHITTFSNGYVFGQNIISLC